MSKETVEKKLKELNKNYNLYLTRPRIFLFKGEIFISTKDTAKFLGTDYHNFCTKYSHVITSKVRMAKLARAKYYNVDDLIKLISENIKTGITILTLCTKSKKR